jgi:hypothetical protein
MRCFARWLTEPFYRSWAQVTLGEYIEVMARRPVVHDDFNDSSMVILSWPYPSYLYNYTVSGYSIPRLVQLTPHFVPQWGLQCPSAYDSTGRWNLARYNATVWL